MSLSTDRCTLAAGKLEVFHIRIGILIDSFDPVCIAQMDACLSALSAGADLVIPVLAGNPSACSAPADDRWKMLVAAASCSKSVSPLRLSAKHESSSEESIFRHLKKKYPKDRLTLLRADGGSSGLCPSVREYCMVKGLYGFPSRLSHAGPWLDQLFEALNPHRFAHSLSVAGTSVDLAEKYGVDILCAEEAGLLHDCAKCLPLSEMQQIARRNHLTDDPGLLESSALLHSLAGAWVARTQYGIQDPEILKAIEYHNTGHAGMSRLAMCICLADFIEPNREPFPSLEEVRSLSEISLEKALLLSLERVADHVLSRGKSLHPRTLNTIAWLKTLPAVQSSAESSL